MMTRHTLYAELAAFSELTCGGKIILTYDKRFAWRLRFSPYSRCNLFGEGWSPSFRVETFPMI